MEIGMQSVADKFGIGEVKVSQLLPGYMNTSHRLVTEKGEFVLRKSVARRTIEHVRFEVGILHRLRNSEFGDYVVDTIPTPEGADFLELDGTVCTLFEFVGGETTLESQGKQPPSWALVEDLAKVSSLLHRSLSSFGKITSTKEPFHAEILRSFDVIEAQGHDTSSLKSLLPILRSNSLLHTDIRLKNLVLRNSRIFKLLDFDDLTNGPPSYDLAWTIKECFGAKESDDASTILDFQRTRHFLDCYRCKIRREVPDEDVTNMMKLACVRVLAFLYETPHIEFGRKSRLIAHNRKLLELLSDGTVLERLEATTTM